MASASPSWVILGSVAKVSAADADIPPDTDLSLALPPPPRVAVLTIPRRVFPCRTAPDNFPSVLAVDASGLLLLHAAQGPAAGPTFIDLPNRQEFCWRPFVSGYFVLHSESASAFPLPNPELIMNPGQLGLISSPEGAGSYMVAELQPIGRGEQADLLCFSSQSGQWAKKEVRHPLPLPPRPFTPNGVVSHSGRLWWVDLSWGLLACNPFEDAPVLSVVPLPPRKALKYRDNTAVLDKHRRVAVSCGKLRFVDLYKNHNSFGSAQISVWTLADPDSTEWTLEYEATFSEIYNDASFKATRVARQLPVLALIHPRNPYVVYFFSSASTCLPARSCSASSTSWLRSSPANTSPPVSFTLGGCHRLSAQLWMPMWRNKTQEEIKKSLVILQSQLTKLKSVATTGPGPSGVG